MDRTHQASSPADASPIANVPPSRAAIASGTAPRNKPDAIEELSDDPMSRRTSGLPQRERKVFAMTVFYQKK
ncbi:hypothetical protein C6401_14075 [Arthrobacter woluwensis]|nr:hypothetical protein C6401_14075 [Arthrobacter woluwensis]